jgi:UDP:flavonoid glycosyltransferase YjiC (YdhE family)
VRVLVSSTPGAGHVFPMVPVVLALRAAGHEVLWATGGEARPWLARLGIEHVPAGLDTVSRHRLALDRAPGLGELAPLERRVVIGPTTFGLVAAPPMVDELRPVLDREQPDLVLTEPCELAAAVLAKARGLPHVTIGFGGLLPDPVVAGMVEAVAPLWEAEGLAVPLDAGLYQHLYLHPFPPSLGPVPDDRPITPMRPAGFDGAEGDPPPWVSDLGQDRALVYVTFGTEFSPQAPFGPLFEALDLVDAEVVVTVGGRLDSGSLPAVPGNVRVEQFVPQRALVERASLVVSHAGSGTILGAAAHGVPQLCLPLGADQFDNANAVAAAGAGSCLTPDEVTAASLRAAISALLADPPAAAGRLAAETAAMPAPEDLVGTITAVASA